MNLSRNYFSSHMDEKWTNMSVSPVVVTADMLQLFLIQIKWVSVWRLVSWMCDEPFHLQRATAKFAAVCYRVTLGWVDSPTGLFLTAAKMTLQFKDAFWVSWIDSSDS